MAAIVRRGVVCSLTLLFALSTASTGAQSPADEPACLEEPPRSDVDGDGVVDGNDWEIVFQAIM